MSTQNDTPGQKVAVDSTGKPIDWTPRPVPATTVEAEIPKPDTDPNHNPVPFQVAHRPAAVRDGLVSDLLHVAGFDVTPGDLHKASNLVGDQQSIMGFLADIEGLTPTSDWFSSTEVADAAREFASAWYVGGKVLVEDLDADAEKVRAVAVSYYDDDGAAATAYKNLFKKSLDQIETNS